jgi:phospho-N-acetylmuramoyl-pentapeptide-transferase
MAGVLVSTLLWANLANHYVWVVLFVTVGFGAIGFYDDYLKVTKQSHKGFSGRSRLAIEALIAAVACIAISYMATPGLANKLALPFSKELIFNLGWFYIVFAGFVVVGAGNAVNITDGLDGLVAGTSTLVFIAFVIIAFTEFRHPAIYEVLQAQALDLAIIAAAMMGACAGFLWWNAAPARIFMGDTGALAIGGAIAGLALLTRTVLLLPLLGGLYLVETLSVLAQIISYRGFKRRVLRMAPIHHHFELGGWSEFTIIVRFWLFAGACVAFGVGLFYADFIRVPGVLE